VGNDHIWAKACNFQALSRTKTGFTANRFALEISQPRLKAGCVALVWRVTFELNAVQLVDLECPRSQGPHLVTLLSKRRCQVLELPRIVLMNKKYFHCCGWKSDKKTPAGGRGL
jgi:hypothetical protein